MGEREDGPDVVVVDAVARVDDQPEPVRMLAPGAQPGELGVGGGGEPGVGEGARVQLDDGRADGPGRLDLRGFRADEQGDLDAGRGERGHGRRDALALAGDLEAALGRDLLARLGDEADGGGPELPGEIRHSRRAGHLEVEAHAGQAGDRQDIVLLDVAPVLAEVDRDPVGAPGQGLAGEGERARFGVRGSVRPAVAGLAERRRVVDVDAEEDRSAHCFFSFSSSFWIFSLSCPSLRPSSGSSHLPK